MRRESGTPNLSLAGESPPDPTLGVDRRMSKQKHQATRSKIETRRREAIRASATMTIAVTIPIVCGTATMVYDWPTVPFGLSCVIGMGVFVSARERLRESRIADHIRDSEKRTSSLVRRSVATIRRDLKATVRAVEVAQVKEFVQEADRRLKGL